MQAGSQIPAGAADRKDTADILLSVVQELVAELHPCGLRHHPINGRYGPPRYGASGGNSTELCRYVD